MKKYYKESIIEIINLDSNDLILTSDGEDENESHLPSGGGNSSGYPSGNDPEDEGYTGYH